MLVWLQFLGQLYGGPGTAQGDTQRGEACEEDDAAGLMHRSERDRDEVEQGGDAESDLCDGRCSGKVYKTARVSRQGVA